MQNSPKNPHDGAQDAARKATLNSETVELGEAARALHLTAQGLWTLIEQAGMVVLRRRQGAGGVSAITRIDYERLRTVISGGAGAVVAPPGTAPGLPALTGLPALNGTRDPGSPYVQVPRRVTEEDYVDPLMERLRESEVRIQEHLAEAEDARSALEATRMSLAQARERTQQLRGRFEAELRAAARTLAVRNVELEQALEALRDQESQRHAAEQAVVRARAEADEEHRTLREEVARLRGEYAGRVGSLRRGLHELRRQLALAHEVEQANTAYIDRLELPRNGQARRA